MAYLDLDNMFAAPVTSRAARVDGRTGFSALEWHVIAIAKADGLGSLAVPGRFARALRVIFATPARSPLADARLEALRRLAVHAWHGPVAPPAIEIERCRAAGFHRGQIETLVAHVAGLRTPG